MLDLVLMKSGVSLLDEHAPAPRAHGRPAGEMTAGGDLRPDGPSGANVTTGARTVADLMPGEKMTSGDSLEVDEGMPAAAVTPAAPA